MTELPAWLTTRPIAHRGLHDATRPENSLAAFSAACEAGHPIELDVQLLSDGTLAVFHDEVLERATGRKGALFEEDRGSIAALRLFGTGESIPTLDHVLALVSGRVPLMIELKKTRTSRGLEAALCRVLRGYAGEFAVQSFDPSAVLYFREHAPEFVRGQLAGPLHDDGLSCLARFAAQRLLSVPATRPHFVNFDIRGLPDAWVTRVAHSFEMPILCWTVRTTDDRAKAQALGVNYVFDGEA